jgi:hypothetical protein
MKSWLLGCTLLLMSVHHVHGEEMSRPFYPLTISDKGKLQTACEPFLKLSRANLLAMVPPQSGFLFGGCPHCNEGSVENNIVWDFSLGDKVQCKYCKTIFPSARYPENGEVKLPTPQGREQTFRYYQSPAGKKYWFESRRWYIQRQLVENAAYDLSQLYAVDPVANKEAGVRAAGLLVRFAEVYPGYIVHFDYPDRAKQFFTDKIPEDIGAYRAAKWQAWAFMDVSRPLLLAYDQLKSTELFTAPQRKIVETDLFTGMLDYVNQFDDAKFGNMHPTLWRSQITAAKVLNRPAIAAQVVEKIGRMIREDFNYDGFWRETSVSYHLQTTGNLQMALSTLRPDLKGDAFNAWMQREYPQASKGIIQAFKAAEVLRLPNGKYAALSDSWAVKVSPEPVSPFKPTLLPGLGYGTLGAGQGDDLVRANLTFTGRFGHHHFDSLNIFLFAKDAELVSDIGYTHTRARPWASSSLSHNTVLIDQKNQSAGEAPANARGNVLLYNTDDAGFQVIEAEARDAYPGLATDYRRLLATISSPGGACYVVDVFNVTGGKQHDWLLHGSADVEQTIELTDSNGQPASLQDVASLLPATYKFEPSKTEVDFDPLFEGPWAYGNLRDIKSAATANTLVATFRNNENPQRGLRSWLLGVPANKIYTTRSQAVRGTGKPLAEDDSKLDQRFRSSIMVRRDNPTDRFVAVHSALTGDTAIKKVSQLPLFPNGTALKIERAGGTDYVFIGDNQSERTGQDGAVKFSFAGRVGLVQLNGAKVALKMIGGTRLNFGTHTLTAPSNPSSKLLKVEANTLTVSGKVAVTPGQVIRITHGDGRVTAFHVESVSTEGGNTVINTFEPPVLQGAIEGTLDMLTFPKMKLPAPHNVAFDDFTASPQVNFPQG